VLCDTTVTNGLIAVCKLLFVADLFVEASRETFLAVLYRSTWLPVAHESARADMVTI
jgi:hypothetical protein